MPGASEVSEHTQQLIDEGVRRIVEEAHQQVVALLRENRDKLDALAQALLEHETLDEDEAYAAVGVRRAATAEAPLTERRFGSGPIHPCSLSSRLLGDRN